MESTTQSMAPMECDAPINNNNKTIPQEEMVANVLHVLSSYTKITPLTCKCTWDNGTGKITWNLKNWLEDFGGRAHDSDDNILKQIEIVFVDNKTQSSQLMSGNRPDDDSLWKAGLKMLKTCLYQEGDDDAIPPHELLRVVMDSYYCNDHDWELETLNLPTDTKQSSSVNVPTPIAMLCLRIFMICHALQKAVEDTKQQQSSAKAVRWRRLRSMVDDSLSLFQRMLFDYVGKAITNVVEEDDIHPSLSIEPSHVIEIAAWMYTQHLYPSCGDLLSEILRNETSNRSGSKPDKVLESCYNSFRMLTSLLSLDVTLVKQEYTNPSQSVQWILKCIEAQSTNDLFKKVISAQDRIAPKNNDNMNELSDDEEDDDMSYQPWKDRAHDLKCRGLSLEEDLLLITSIRKQYDFLASTPSFYDELGIAIIAYWKLSEHLSKTIDPLPYPYSTAHRWKLLFPHIATLLGALSASSTMARMDSLEVLSPSDQLDKYMLEMNLVVFSLGLDMLNILITTTPAIRPLSNGKPSSAEGLQSTVTVLLSHVVRMSSLEMSMGSTPNSEVTGKYSSLQIMNITRSLLSFYTPLNQIETIQYICQTIKHNNQDRVILPRAIDFIRPLAMDMFNNTEQYASDGYIAASDLKVMLQISQVLDIFLLDLYDVFAIGSACHMPRNVDEFMSMSETYAAALAILRLQKMWMARCQIEANQQSEMIRRYYDRLTQWMNIWLSKLSKFGTSLSNFITYCEESADAPQDFHHLYLLQLSLQDALGE